MSPRYTQLTVVEIALVMAIAAPHCIASTGVTLEDQVISSNDPAQVLVIEEDTSAKFDIDSDTACLIKFQKLANEWRQQRGAMSSITEMSMLPAYQAILGMGPSAIKPIIAQLKSEGDEPDQWFWALRSITEANPVKADEQGDFIKMAQAWIRWAENEGYAG